MEIIVDDVLKNIEINQSMGIDAFDHQSKTPASLFAFIT